MSSVVEVSRVSHSYGERLALDSVSFGVSAAECFGVVGPNGGGKSTAFRILTTLMKPTQGSVHLFGIDAVRSPYAVRERLGVVFQHPALDPKLTVEENLLHHGLLFGMRGKSLRTRADALMARVGVLDRRSERVAVLSGGFRRRVEIAKALLQRPQLLVLDEPTTGLDPLARREIWEYLRILRESEGVTVLVSTHLLEEADRCDHVIMLDGGRVVAFDSPVKLKRMLGGDVIRVSSTRPQWLVSAIQTKFGLSATLVGDEVRIERERGHELISELMKSFPEVVESITLGRPTLEDLFIQKTGKRLTEVQL